MGADVVGLAPINIAQTSSPVKAAVVRLLETYRHEFPASPNNVPACNHAKLQVSHVTNNCRPTVAQGVRNYVLSCGCRGRK